MVTLKEVAQMCNVSISTVSNILNGKPKVSEETKKRVLQVMQETGYQPNYFAQGMRKQKTQIIGILAEDLHQFSSPGVIEGIMAYCESHNYRTVLENMRLYDRWGCSWYDQEKLYDSVLEPALQQLMSIKVDGIIYVAGHARIINCFPEDFRLPAVVAYAYSGSRRFPSVVIDDEKGGYDITRYLLENGHRKIGVIAGDRQNIHTQKRALGYQKALFEDQLLFNPDWIQYGDWERQSGYEAAVKLLEDDVTAIFCMNELMAGGAYDYIYEHGLKPGTDISVVGYDNRELSGFFGPPLTTMEIPLTTIGENAGRVLLRLLQADKEEAKEEWGKEYLIPCKLIERKSVLHI